MGGSRKFRRGMGAKAALREGSAPAKNQSGSISLDEFNAHYSDAMAIIDDAVAGALAKCQEKEIPIPVIAFAVSNAAARMLRVCGFERQVSRKTLMAAVQAVYEESEAEFFSGADPSDEIPQMGAQSSQEEQMAGTEKT